jgi:hypothetical protein
MPFSSLAQWHGSPNHYNGRYGYHIDHITLHIIVGDSQGALSTFDNPNSQASSNYVIGSTGSTFCCVDENNGAWADGSFESNCSTISIEHAGGMGGYPNTDACVRASAELCADIAKRMGWDKLEHGVNVFLHRDIPPYLHPNCPDICPNPLRWQEIINQANIILNSGGVTKEMEGEGMQCAYSSDQFNGMKFWDGVHAPVGIANQSQLNVLMQIYKANTGRDLPLFQFNGAWAVEAERMMVSSSQPDMSYLSNRLDGIDNELQKISGK